MIIRNCAVCNKKFKVSFNQIKFGRGKFCSTICQYEAKRKHATFKCKICKIIFKTKPSLNQKTCSIKCSSKYRSKTYRREKAFNWKGGRINNEGYTMVVVQNHPKAARKCTTEYLLEHRLIMEKKLGRYLNSDEIIHHINGVKTDNRIENLRLMTNSEHKKLHTSQRDNNNGQFLKGRAIIYA